MNQDPGRELARLAQKLSQQLREAARQSIGRLAREVIQDTPVRTGALRGAWRSGRNQAPAGTGRPDPTGEAPAREAAAAAARLDWGDTFYLLNRLPYARAVEHGSSRQAPRGMLRLNAARFSQLVDQALARLGRESG